MGLPTWQLECSEVGFKDGDGFGVNGTVNEGHDFGILERQAPQHIRVVYIYGPCGDDRFRGLPGLALESVKWFWTNGSEIDWASYM
ncbi:hypothetical protein Tco_1136708 [Tanacetum coccineum]